MEALLSRIEGAAARAEGPKARLGDVLSDVELGENCAPNPLPLLERLRTAEAALRRFTQRVVAEAEAARPSKKRPGKDAKDGTDASACSCPAPFARVLPSGADESLDNNNGDARENGDSDDNNNHVPCALCGEFRVNGSSSVKIKRVSESAAAVVRKKLHRLVNDVMDA
jgi:hypothetical protein